MNSKTDLKTSGGIFDIEKKQEELKNLFDKREAPGFWDDQRAAQVVIDRITSLENPLKTVKDLSSALEDVTILNELAEEENDETAFKEVTSSLDSLEMQINDFEFRTMLGGQDDPKNVIVSINAGAGGTESQDWAQMLLRMYLRWAESHGYQAETVDLLEAEGGIKSVTVHIKGDHVYGHLKGENGIHRLVRISPFDSGGRRHTSFASAFCLPELEEEIEVEINPDDLRVDTYRAQGAGGQHVNKTDSAVRITHLSTGIVVQCQNERSQHKNRAMAMKVLKARLYSHYEQERMKEQKELEKDKKDISWGNQIRSYVFQPYTMVKDHRTKQETGNIQAVMDGKIDPFIEEYLKFAWDQSR